MIKSKDLFQNKKIHDYLFKKSSSQKKGFSFLNFLRNQKNKEKTLRT